MKINYIFKKVIKVALILLCAVDVKAGGLTFQINGKVKGESRYQYAYLYQSESKKLSRARIENQQFGFAGEFILDKKGFNSAFIFLSNDSLAKYIGQREVILKKMDRQYRSIIMEGVPIDIIIEDDDVKNAKVKGGKISSDCDEMDKAISELKYKEFIDSHTDSPISLLLIRSILRLKKFPIIDQLDFQELYDKLSDKIKQSEYGLETLKKIGEQKN